jgi:hypothetical protein
MKKIFLLTALLVCVMLTSANAQDEIWTEIGIYGFMTSISGDMQVGDTTSDVDVSFHDILENLDMGFMGFVEHRRGRWSFMADVAYLDVEAKDTKITNRRLSLTLTADVEFEQILAEGFIGYRVLAQDHGDAQFGLDLLGGARYNKLEAKLDEQTTLLDLTTAASRNPSKDWVDGVIALRVQYGHNNGWGVSAWADVGDGSDSNSYQLFGLVNYRFENSVRVFAGYRFYHMEYDGVHAAAPYELDLDYLGPTIGVSYRF